MDLIAAEAPVISEEVVPPEAEMGKSFWYRDVPLAASVSHSISIFTQIKRIFKPKHYVFGYRSIPKKRCSFGVPIS